MADAKHPRGWITTLLGLIVVFCVVATFTTSTASAASPTACKVRNVSRGGAFGTLAAAVKAARNGNTLVVRGTCHGSTKISDKSLRIVGRWTKRSKAPTLRGNGKRSVLRISGEGRRVTLERLTIRAKPTRVLRGAGGGIWNQDATLTLRKVKVIGFTTRGSGGGIYNLTAILRLEGSSKVAGNSSTRSSGGGVNNVGGTVVLKDHARVAGNSAAGEGGGIASVGSSARLILRQDSAVQSNTARGYGGGGVSADGLVTLHDRASIRGNVATPERGAGYGGGYQGSGVLVMNDASSISGNTAVVGGGVRSGGDITMQDDSTVSGNTATVGAGGIDHRYGTVTGVVCHPAADANVFGNSPDECKLH